VRFQTLILWDQKTGQVLVRTPEQKKPVIPVAEVGYVRSSEIDMVFIGCSHVRWHDPGADQATEDHRTITPGKQP
jgi:hypothetical protein